MNHPLHHRLKERGLGGPGLPDIREPMFRQRQVLFLAEQAHLLLLQRDQVLRSNRFASLNIVDRRVVTRRCSRRDDLVRREIMCSSCGQIIHEAGDPDQEQEKQEHEIEHQQGVEGHQLHRARTTFSTITHIYTRILTQARSLNPPTEFSFTLNFYYSFEYHQMFFPPRRGEFLNLNCDTN